MIESISPHQAITLMEKGSLDVVDVREPNEWSAGHIAGARLVPLGHIKARPTDALQRDGVIFVCAGGVRSLMAAHVAESVGLNELYSIEGGTNGWAKAGLPIVRD